MTRFWTHAGASNAVVPLVALAGTLGSSALAGFTLTASTLVLVASGSFLVYCVENHGVRAASDAINCPSRRLWAQSHRSLLACAVVAGTAGLLVSLSVQRLAVWVILVPLSLITFAYQNPLHPGRALKRHPLLKPLLVATGWSAGVVLLPAAASGAPLSGVVWAAFAYRAAPYFVNAVLCDIPDVPGDRAAGIRTLPMILGDRRTVRWCAVPCLAATLILIAFSLSGPTKSILALDAVGLLLLPLAVGWPSSPAVSRDRLVLTVNAAMLWPFVTWMVGGLW